MNRTHGPLPAADQVCVRCGGVAENDFVDFWLCTDCYFVAGSTCAGISLPKQHERSHPVC